MLSELLEWSKTERKMSEKEQSRSEKEKMVLMVKVQPQRQKHQQKALKEPTRACPRAHTPPPPARSAHNVISRYVN